MLSFRRINRVNCIISSCLVVLSMTSRLITATSSTTATRHTYLSTLSQESTVASKLVNAHHHITGNHRDKERHTSQAKHDVVSFEEQEPNIAAAAAEALSDFELHLKFMGKESIDEEAFGMLLDDIGYKRCREGLFEALIAEVANASPEEFDASKNAISIRDMYHLYQSDPYKLPTDAAYASGEALVSHIDNLFEKADVSGDNVLDSDEFGSFLTQLFNGRQMTENELTEAIKVMDTNNDGTIDLGEFKNCLLNAGNVNVASPRATQLSSSKARLPKKLIWGATAKRFPKNAFCLQIPDEVKHELHIAVLEYVTRGVAIDDVDLMNELPTTSLSSLRSFSVVIRNALLHHTGVVMLKGLDLDAFEFTDSTKLEACAKFAYYLICNHVGSVDGEARGKLFDVKDHNLNAMDSKNDNVLFSASNCEADWHTDGASKHKVYDVVSLMCIRPSELGGKSKISNACNAYDVLSSRMPKFLTYELLRPITRDILENGKGNEKKLNMRLQMGRADSVMPLRICYNSYPIFAIQPNRMRFRYMRYWIETAHTKMGWKIPTLLKISMDVLDDTLDEECYFHERLERGDIIMCNNALIAHGRDAFTDTSRVSRRHLVRAWLQLKNGE